MLQEDIDKKAAEIPQDQLIEPMTELSGADDMLIGKLPLNLRKMYTLWARLMTAKEDKLLHLEIELRLNRLSRPVYNAERKRVDDDIHAVAERLNALIAAYFQVDKGSVLLCKGWKVFHTTDHLFLILVAKLENMRKPRE